MTATILQFEPRRKAAPPQPTRTPELAFILAIFATLSAEAQAKSVSSIRAMARANPDCEASQDAANIADMLSRIGRA